MRVIAGSARGRPLRGPRSKGTRPTSDKVKGAIFSMIESLFYAIDLARQERDAIASADDQDGAALSTRWEGRRLLDLYSGSGALGIEALSRGAGAVDFVDSSAESCDLIRANLLGTGLSGKDTRVVRALADQVVAKPADFGLRGPYDVVIADPPYADADIEVLLRVFGGGSHLAEWPIVVIEHSRRNQPAESIGQLDLIRRRRHGDTEISLYSSHPAAVESGSEPTA